MPTIPGRAQQTLGTRGYDWQHLIPPTHSPERGPSAETPSSSHTLTTPAPFGAPAVTIPEGSLATLPLG